MAAPLVFGRVKGIRGSRGEVTVTVVSGNAERWVNLGRVVLAAGPHVPADGLVAVESARAYRDRLVLKLAGFDDGNTAAALRGLDVAALPEDLPELPTDEYWVESMIGSQVEDEVSGVIGRVTDVIETGGVDLLVVRDSAGVETLVPLAKAYWRGFDPATSTIRVALPEGLRGMNDVAGPETA